MLVVTRYRVPSHEREPFLDEARAAVEALAACRGCRALRVGRAIDDPDLWVMQSEWESVGAYRRALSSYDVKLRAVPLMYRCIDEPSAFEVLLDAVGGSGLREHRGFLADEGTDAGR